MFPSPLVVLALIAMPVVGLGQDRLRHMPRFDRFEKMQRDIVGSIVSGAISARWTEDSKAFTYSLGGKNYRFDVQTLTAQEIESLPPGPPGIRRPVRRQPERGRQFDVAYSADGKLKAFHRDRNLYLSDADGSGERPITRDGNERDRTKNGIASWVYGEELNVREAIWFSPDSKKLAFYRFDESQVKDYFVTLDHTQFQTSLDVEAYPKAGTPNPKVALLVYDLETGTTTPVDTAFGPNGQTNSEYVFEVRWSPSGKELLFHRMNRKQNVLELCAANPDTGECRVILRESQPDSWTDYRPAIVWFADKDRFLWLSERNGYRNIYLYRIDGTLVRPITQHSFEVDNVVKLDETAGYVFYTARSGDNPYLMQLHRVRLNGTGDVRLTDPLSSHRVTISPDSKWVVDVAQSYDLPPQTRLLDAQGKVVATIAKSDITRFESLNLRKRKRIKFPSLDGSTILHGNLQFPSDFDPSQKYPVIVEVYAGPDWGGSPERFGTPSPLTEFGFIVAQFEGRGTFGRGKAFRSAIYGKLGVMEVDDQAAGAKYLQSLTYVKADAIGIYGTSYGGYASIMALLRHPDFFKVAVASSSVTDWRHYNTIYTERYMGLPWENENKAGYDAGSANTYAAKLQGRLMLFFGTADNNVHPANSLMFAQALNRAGKSYDMMVGPDEGHVSLNWRRTVEYFLEHLVVRPNALVFRDLRATESFARYQLAVTAR